MLAVTKNNLAPMPPPLGYRVRRDAHCRGVVEWTGPLDVSADDLGRRIQSVLPARERAALWLHQELAGGPRPSAEVLAAAAAAGIPERTLERGKSDAGVKSHRVKLKNDERVWYWYDPAAPWPKDAPFKKPRPGELPELEDLW